MFNIQTEAKCAFSFWIRSPKDQKKQTSSKTGVHIFCLGLFYWEFLNLTADKCSVKLNRVKG